MLYKVQHLRGLVQVAQLQLVVRIVRDHGRVQVLWPLRVQADGVESQRVRVGVDHAVARPTKGLRSQCSGASYLSRAIRRIQTNMVSDTLHAYDWTSTSHPSTS